MSKAKPTPLMEQYERLKNEAPDALLLFRLGDFYELFGEDAKIASKILDITLTTRDKNKENPVPMAGVPFHSIDGYLQKLLDAGKKVAISEQKNVTVDGKTLVEREIVRVLSPAIRFHAEVSENQYLAFLQLKRGKISATFFDPSTGDSRIASQTDPQELSDILRSLNVPHILLFESESETFADLEFGNILIEKIPSNYLTQESSLSELKKNFDQDNLDSFGFSGQDLFGLGILFRYVRRSQKIDSLKNIRHPKKLFETQQLKFGPHTASHLDLIPDKDLNPNLFDLINKTKSSMGNRCLKSWLLQPLTELDSIKKRQEAILELSKQHSQTERLRKNLGDIYDLDRISGRVSAKLAQPRDTLALGKSLASLPEIIETIRKLKSQFFKEWIERISPNIKTFETLSKRILKTQKDPAPFVSRDGGIFDKGFNGDLDRLIEIDEKGHEWLLKLEKQERERTGIPSLKVKYNRVFGYFIEVTKVHLKNVPDNYQRKQSMVNAERFFTEELKKFEEEILTESSKRKNLEQGLFDDLVSEIEKAIRPILNCSELLGDLDSIQSLSLLALKPGWSFPEMDSSKTLFMEAGRHPIVDESLNGRFVPNSIALGENEKHTISLITGPNMGGKSTLMRQVALIVILGQMGAPIPAQSASWGIFDAIFTRIGANDAIASGQSTFMVEMSELAHILENATDRSLIVLDEIGRGTSTFDGMSVAAATLEWISDQIQARTLFATHYHELTEIAESLPNASNQHMAVEEYRDKREIKLRFLYQIHEGPAHKSFGIQVARLAGLPKKVIQRASRILGNLEKSPVSTADPLQMTLFQQVADSRTDDLPEGPQESEFSEILEELQKLEINSLTPLDALNRVSGWVDTVNRKNGA